MFKVGDIISFFGASGSPFGLYLIIDIFSEDYELVTLDHTESLIDITRTTPFRWPKTLVNTEACMSFENLIHLETNGRHACHCPKEVWMYQGCKCGGF